MKIELGQTIQSLANVGVIAGIVFLAIEIRQNTESLEINAYQELIAQINSQSELSLTNPEASLRFNYLADLSADDLSREDITVEERLLVNNYLFLPARHGDLAYYQYEKGMLSEDRFESSLGELRNRWCSALFRDFWPQRSFNFVSGYRQFIDSKIGEC